MITFGLDISHHQDIALNLAQCRRDGCEFVFLKATEGATFTDSEFAANLAEARAAGMLVAAYVYQRAGVTAAAHVERVKAVVPRDVPVIPDVEAGSGSLALTRDLVNGLRAAGYRVPLLYLPLWYWRDHLGSPSLGGLPPLWSSRYPDNVVGTIAEEWADVPAHYWNGYGGLPVAVLQFTSSSRIAGHQPLDANAFRGTRAELAALLGGQTQEDDMPLSNEDLVKIHDVTWFGAPGARLIGNRRLGNGEWAETLLGSLEDRVIRQVLVPMQQVLLKAVLESDANDVTADSLAAALVPAILPDLKQGIQDAVGGLADVNLTAEQIDAIADATVAEFATKLASPQGA